MICGFCGRIIEPNELCHQIRVGYLNDNDEFVPDEDYAYHCLECGVATGNFSSGSTTQRERKEE